MDNLELKNEFSKLQKNYAKFLNENKKGNISEKEKDQILSSIIDLNNLLSDKEEIEDTIENNSIFNAVLPLCFYLKLQQNNL